MCANKAASFTAILLDGFEEDVTNFINHFEEKNSIRYNSFVEVWNSLNFSHIYDGRSVKEYIIFTGEALSYIKNYFIKETEYLKKVCAIYLLYGFYYLQLIKHSGAIVITLEEWFHFKEFIFILTEHQHLDTLYILLHLIFDNAFEFAALTNKSLLIKPSELILNDKISEKPTDFSDIGENLLVAAKKYKEAKAYLTRITDVAKIDKTSDTFAGSFLEECKQMKLVDDLCQPSTSTFNNHDHQDNNVPFNFNQFSMDTSDDSNFDPDEFLMNT